MVRSAAREFHQGSASFSLCPAVCSENVIPRLLPLVNDKMPIEWTQHLKEGEGGHAFSFFLSLRSSRPFPEVTQTRPKLAGNVATVFASD